MNSRGCCSGAAVPSVLAGVGAAIGVVLLLAAESRSSAQGIPLAHRHLHHHVAHPDVRAVRSGRWSEPATWSGGAVPAPLGKISIPAGVTVTVDREFPDALEWVNVEGTLQFQPDARTALTAHTVVVMESGRLDIGTPSQPVSGAATLTFSSLGRDIDHTVDPLELMLGLIVMGQAQIHGLAKTSWMPVSAAPPAGATRLKPDRVPEGWQRGDRLILTASTYGQEEELTFERIENGAVVFAEPLKHARVFPETGLAVHLGNLTRSVVIRSDPADAGNVKRQAHVMLMSEPHAHDIRYAEFRDLGRTTIDPVTDPRLLRDGTRDPSICPPYIPAENVRARYALHFHHVGERLAAPEHRVQGVSIHVQKRSRLKVGLINHSSNVIVEDSVGYNIDGSTFMTEEGNEIGGFLRNLAVSSFGSNLANEDQPREIHLRNGGCADLVLRRRLDMGHNGSGFWVHSAGVDTIGNVAAGHTNAGFDLWTTPLSHPVDKPNAPPFLMFEAKYLRKGARWSNGKLLPLNRVPGLLRDNAAYAAGFQRHGRKAGFALSHGLQAQKTPEVGYTIVDGFLAWNVEQGVDSEYTSMTIWRNLRLIAGNRAPGSIGVGLRRQAAESNNEVHSARITGFTECLHLGDKGRLSEVQCDGGTIVTSDPRTARR